MPADDCTNVDGRLLDHWSICDACDGYGTEDRSDRSDDAEDCTRCDGDGKQRWGSYYGQDAGICENPTHAGANGSVWIAAMYEGDREWTCFRCYVDHHAEECGCERWRWAEELLELPAVVLRRTGDALVEGMLREAAEFCHEEECPGFKHEELDEEAGDPVCVAQVCIRGRARRALEVELTRRPPKEGDQP